MKKLIWIAMPFVLSAVLLGEQKKAAAKSTPKPAAAAQPEGPLTVPQGAKEVEPYLFTYTSKDGKKWFYRQTPFGVVKWEDKPITTPPMADNTNPVVITDLGDSVRFEWSSPFGDQKWVRKKSELTPDEKAMMEREQNKRAAPDPTAKTSEKQ